MKPQELKSFYEAAAIIDQGPRESTDVPLEPGLSPAEQYAGLSSRMDELVGSLIEDDADDSPHLEGELWNEATVKTQNIGTFTFNVIKNAETGSIKTLNVYADPQAGDALEIDDRNELFEVVDTRVVPITDEDSESNTSNRIAKLADAVETLEAIVADNPTVIQK